MREDPEKFARESNSMRRMAQWQVWAITTVCVALLAGAAMFYFA